MLSSLHLLYLLLLLLLSLSLLFVLLLLLLLYIILLLYLHEKAEVSVEEINFNKSIYIHQVTRQCENDTSEERAIHVDNGVYISVCSAFGWYV